MIPPPQGPDDSKHWKQAIDDRIKDAAAELTPDQAAEEAHMDFTNQCENFIVGLLPREDKMLAILNGIDSSAWPKPIPPPKPPAEIKFDPDPAKDTLYQYLDGLRDFQFEEHKRYAALSPEAQKMYGETDVWRQLLAEKQEANKQLLNARTQSVRAALQLSLEDLNSRVGAANDKVANMQSLIDYVATHRDYWSNRKIQLAQIAETGPPTIDLPGQAREVRHQKIENAFRGVLASLFGSAADSTVSYGGGNSSSYSYQGTSYSYGGASSNRGSGSSSANAADTFRRSMDAQNEELKKYDTIVHNVYYGNGNVDWDQRGAP